jgi:hypothetical protein
MFAVTNRTFRKFWSYTILSEIVYTLHEQVIT